MSEQKASIAQPRFRVQFERLHSPKYKVKKKTDIEKFVDHLAKEDEPSNDWLRSKMREDGFARKICPPRLIKPEEIDEQGK